MRVCEDAGGSHRRKGGGGIGERRRVGEGREEKGYGESVCFAQESIGVRCRERERKSNTRASERRHHVVPNWLFGLGGRGGDSHYPTGKTARRTGSNPPHGLIRRAPRPFWRNTVCLLRFCPSKQHSTGSNSKQQQQQMHQSATCASIPERANTRRITHIYNRNTL